MVTELDTALNDATGIWGIVAETLPARQPIMRINAEEVFPAASVIKVPILVALYQQVALHQINLATPIAVANHFQSGGSGILRYLSDQVVMTIKDVAILMMQLSDNTAANILISLIGRNYINEAMYRFGLNNTELRNDKIDPIIAEDTPEIVGITTPHDMATLLGLLAQAAILEPALCHDILDIMRRDRNKQRICGLLPLRPDLVIAHKTGTLGDTCHDIGFVRCNQGQYVLSILSKGMQCGAHAPMFGTTEQTIARISRWVFDRIVQGG